MKDLSYFLEKFKKISHDSLYSQKEIIEILKKHIGREIPLDNIKISKRVLYIHADIFIKQAVFMRKEKILEDIQKVFKDIYEIQ